ncbi:MAG: alpha-galactosidase [Lachnospiraceae bacterium]|nr:alpha-galactosidase [Lachnospiraceae bacterium]
METEKGEHRKSDVVQAIWDTREGTGLREAVFRPRTQLPAGRLKSVEAELAVRLADDGFVFMNGFQTWSYSPELTKGGKTSGIGPLPGKVIRHYGLDRYGDYYFRDYPGKKGISQGYSYCYFREGDVFRLIASLDEKPGYTQFSYHAEANRLTISRDCEGLEVEGEYPVLDLYVAAGSEEEVFDGWFSALGLKAPAGVKISGYTSWYNHYEDITEQSVLRDLEGAAGLLRPGDLFQIDDGWELAVGDWREADPVKFPCGMKAMAQAIHDKGFKAGLWLAPFVACQRSKLYQDHPKWFYFHERQPWYCGSNWGGFYALDFDYPEVREYLKETFRRVFDDWGFDLVKLDFLYAAAPFGDARETRAGRMIRAMEFLRQLCGDKLILGCGVPLMPAFGLVDYCRISCDVGLDWDDAPWMKLANRERISTKQAMESAIYRRQLNGRAFGSDPDVYYLRDTNLKLDSDQKKMLALGCALFGQMRLCSDDMGEYGEAQKDAFQRLRHIAEEARDVRVLHRQEGKKEILEITYRLGDESYSYRIPV